MNRPTIAPNGRDRRLVELAEYQAALMAAVAAFPKGSTNELVRAVERRLKRESDIVGQLITEQIGHCKVTFETLH